MYNDYLQNAVVKIIGVLFLVMVVGAILFSSVEFINGVSNALNETTTETRTILSVTYGETLEGARFSLGYGYLQGEEYYTCYQKADDGGISLLKLNADFTTIYPSLSDGEEAYAVMEISALGSIKSAKLYVPANTIQMEFDFNLGS